MIDVHLEKLMLATVSVNMFLTGRLLHSARR